MGKELVHIDPFLASVPILNPLKMPGKQKLQVFSGGIK